MLGVTRILLVDAELAENKADYRPLLYHWTLHLSAFRYTQMKLHEVPGCWDRKSLIGGSEIGVEMHINEAG